MIESLRKKACVEKEREIYDCLFGKIGNVKMMWDEYHILCTNYPIDIADQIICDIVDKERYQDIIVALFDDAVRERLKGVVQESIQNAAKTTILEMSDEDILWSQSEDE